MTFVKIKFFIKLITYLFFIIFISGLYQSTEYDPAYINKNSIQIDFNNIRTPTLKKIFLSIEFRINNFLFKEDEYKKDNIKIKSLPKFKYVYAPNSFDKALNLDFDNSNNEQWFRSNKNATSQRFSSHKKININNIKDLEIAWTYKSKDGIGSIQSNPIIVENKIITPTPGHYIVAIDSKNGEELWRFKSKSSLPAQRGLIYWGGNSNSKPGIFFSDHAGLYKLDIEHGKLDSSFGNNGFIKTKLSKTAPLIIKDNLIISTFSPSIDIYNINNGKVKWKFFLKKEYDKLYVNSYFKLGGCNPWGGISADIKREIVYITTGNAQPDYFGKRRLGKNKYCNSIIALDIKNKKKLFDFQEIEHDVWNRDIASPPILGSIKKNGKDIDSVIVMSKTGNIITLDRTQGKPIFDLRFRKGDSVDTENSYYLDLEKPQPVENYDFLISDLSDLSKKFNNEARNLLKKKKFGFYIPPSERYELLTWTGYGGVPWTGGSYDDKNDILYVNSNKIPGVIKLKSENTKDYTYEKFNLSNGYPATKPPWGSLNAINLQTGSILWKVPLGEYSDLTKKGFSITGTENYGGVLATAGDIVIVAGTLDKKLRVFNSKNGSLIWEDNLPHPSFISPSTYIRDGEQYIIVIATGGGVLQKKYPKIVTSGDTYIAYKLRTN
jgi:quinoprotein glucose dehydrogenase